jgi:inosine-uridine nucleoside N-ribohydrolase
MNKFKKPIPLILDTDIGTDMDDTWALAMILKSPELDLKLVTTVAADTMYRAKLAAKMLQLAGRTDVPVGIGSASDEHVSYPLGPWVENFDLANYAGVIYEDGVQALIDTIRNSPEPVTVLSIGPMTNLALALERAPDITQNSRIVGMQGSVYMGYDGSEQTVAEWNVCVDPKAAQKVFSSDWNITLTPIDTCGLIALAGSLYQQFRSSADPLVRAILTNYKYWLKEKYKIHELPAHTSVLYDTVAAYLTFSEEWLKMEELPLVVTDDAFTKIDPSGKTIRCAIAWKDMAAFENFLVERLVHQPVVSARPERIAAAL